MISDLSIKLMGGFSEMPVYCRRKYSKMTSLASNKASVSNQSNVLHNVEMALMLSTQCSLGNPKICGERLCCGYDLGVR